MKIIGTVKRVRALAGSFKNVDLEHADGVTRISVGYNDELRWPTKGEKIAIDGRWSQNTPGQFLSDGSWSVVND